MKRRERSDGNSQNQGERHRDRPELKCHGKSLAYQFRHREILVLEGGTEIAVCQRAEVASVLGPNRSIQAVRTLQVGHDFGRQRLLLIERAARGRADEEKGNSDNDEQGGNRAGQAGQKVAQHPA